MFEKLKKTFSSWGKKVEEEATPKEKKKLFVRKATSERVPRASSRAEGEREAKKQARAEAKAQKKAEREAKKAEKIKAKAAKQVEKEKAKEEPTEKKSIFAGITETKISEDKFETLFEDLEDELLQNNVSTAIIDKIKEDLQKQLVDKSLKRSEVANIIKNSLSKLIHEILTKPKQIDLLELAKTKKPLVILFVGVNGVGKTTTIAKLAKMFQDNKLSCVLAAGDTFRAAAIEQLEYHAKKLKVKIIKHKYGADSAAVAYDAVEHAKAKGLNVVLIDTAGRQHANEDLMAELAKIKRVSKPDLVLLIVDSLTGNDAVEQSKFFNEKIGIDGAILTKTDADERGGAIISVGYETGKPILYLGKGQTYKDLEKFDAEKLIKKIGL